MTHLQTVRQALAEFASRYRFDLSAYDSPRYTIKLGPLPLHLPNPGWLFLHDLHHLALGAAPNFWGEVQISAFELRTGPATPFIAFLCIAALFLGLLINPLRTIAIWKNREGTRNLYHANISYELLLNETLEELRQRLGMEPLDGNPIR